MGKSCCAVGCTRRFSKDCGLHFYRFPKDSERRNIWISAVNRKNWEPTEHSWICSSHFVGGVKSDDPSSPAYIPTLFDHVRSPEKRKAEQNLVRYDRIQQSKIRRCEAFDHDQHLISDLIAERDRLKEENLTLKSEKASLYAEISVLRKAVITPESLMDDNAKVKYYTGLPSYKVLKAVFDFLSPCINSYSRTALPLFSQFLMVLVRLRVNMEVQNLSYHFGIHSSNISRTFRRWIDVIYIRLKPLIRWLDREQLYRTMPMELKRKFSKCVVVIDYFKIFME
jgi:hypothetical protein